MGLRSDFVPLGHVAQNSAYVWAQRHEIHTKKKFGQQDGPVSRKIQMLSLEE